MCMYECVILEGFGNVVGVSTGRALISSVLHCGFPSSEIILLKAILHLHSCFDYSLLLIIGFSIILLAFRVSV